ncbi:MAG: VanZ family protein, partial [Butyricicoccus sp.]
NYRESLQYHLELYGWLPHNYVPFRTIMQYLYRLPDKIAIRNLFCGFAVMIPFGILFPWSFPKFSRPVWFFSMCFALCVLAETFQKITYTGAFDVDDILLHFIGCCIGFAVYLYGKENSKNEVTKQ